MFVSTMTTNGYLLTEKVFKEYISSEIKKFQITIDGFKHDISRPTISVKCSVKLSDVLNIIGVLDEKNGVSINEDKNKLWYDSNITKKCITCDKLISCINKRCPMLNVIKNQTETCCY